MSRTIEKLVAANPDIIDDYSDETFGMTHLGPDMHDGYWLYLKPGWRCTHSDTHCIHEWTVKEVMQAWRDKERCDCERCNEGG